MAGIYHLQGTVKHYDWGGFSFIPALLQLPNPGKLPFAEYWMGTHSLGVSTVQAADGEARPLTRHVDSLPFLLKVLDVKDMLSIQVHPSKKAAEASYARENAEGIPIDSPQRNYKDDNHKPELMVALGDFWLLHGFKPKEELVYTLLNVVELRELLPVFNQSGYEGLYKYVMELSQDDVNRILKPLVDNALSVYATEKDRENEDYWAAKAAKSFPGINIDRGIFSIYLFNLVHLKKGEGIFQPAGVPHAYLEGQNVEIMANSDNVLRGGLTTKHIDVGELLKNVKCEATIPEILHHESGAREMVYPAAVPDFRLSMIKMDSGGKEMINSKGAEILLVTEGIVTISCGEERVHLGQGHPAAFVLDSASLEVQSTAGATLFRAVHNG